MIKQSALGLFLVLSLILDQYAFPAANSDGRFTIVNKFNAGGQGRWDLLSFDASHHHIFISRSSHVQVVDSETGKVVGDIPDTDGVHGIAIAEDLNLGFTSNGKSNSVTVFDLNKLNILETIKVNGVNPDAITYEPKTKHILSFNGLSHSVSVIDAIARKEVATIDLPGKPELAVSDNGDNVFVNIEDKNEIAVIDVNTNKVVKIYPFASGTEPTGLAIDIKHHRLFSVCANNKMEILDSETGHVVSEVPIGGGPDSAAFDSELGIALSSNGDGTLTVVKESDPDHFNVLQNLTTQKGARTMVYDETLHRAYLVTATFGETPPPTADQPKPRPSTVPDSFVILIAGQQL